jgi:hypothetical protein
MVGNLVENFIENMGVSTVSHKVLEQGAAAVGFVTECATCLAVGVGLISNKFSQNCDVCLCGQIRCGTVWNIKPLELAYELSQMSAACDGFGLICRDCAAFGRPRL